MRKYNNQTGCYKIDIFYNGTYFCSTDWSKSCKAAKERIIQLHPEFNPVLVKANFFKY